MTAAATEQTVLVDGVSLFMRRVGDGPVTVVLHGGPGAHHDYLLPQYDRLAADRELLYYDQRGGGRSPVARDVPVDWRAHVEDLRSLLVQLDRTPATLLGYSWGGLLALLYTVEHPGTVGRLALVCPAPATARDRGRFEATFAERSRAPAILRERESLHASDLRTRDPEAYRRRLFELSVADWSAYLRVDAPPGEISSVMARLFRSSSWQLRRRLAGRNPASLARLLRP